MTHKNNSINRRQPKKCPKCGGTAPAGERHCRKCDKKERKS